MNIELLCRVRHPSLYERMSRSLYDTSKNVSILREKDECGEPRLAETYNRLIQRTSAEIVGIAHDDIEFLEKGWDSVVRDVFAEYKPDILGVIGSTVYNGGGVFDSGSRNGVGMIADLNGVRILSPRSRYAKAKVVDGCLFFINRKFFEKEPFDTKLDGLFYYDIDLCLRAKEVGVANILVRHSKTKDLYGKYPEGMKLRKDFEDYFESKHGMRQGKQEDQACCLATMELFKKLGRNECLRKFEEKYLCV